MTQPQMGLQAPAFNFDMTQPGGMQMQMPAPFFEKLDTRMKFEGKRISKCD